MMIEKRGKHYCVHVLPQIHNPRPGRARVDISLVFKNRFSFFNEGIDRFFKILGAETIG